MKAGTVPGGICRVVLCATAVNSAIAISTRAPGWKKTFVMLRPFVVWDSMCSMSLTVVVSERSYWVPMRSSMSSAVSPL